MMPLWTVRQPITTTTQKALLDHLGAARLRSKVADQENEMFVLDPVQLQPRIGWNPTQNRVILVQTPHHLLNDRQADTKVGKVTSRFPAFSDLNMTHNY